MAIKKLPRRLEEIKLQQGPLAFLGPYRQPQIKKTCKLSDKLLMRVIALFLSTLYSVSTAWAQDVPTNFIKASKSKKLDLSSGMKLLQDLDTWFKNQNPDGKRKSFEEYTTARNNIYLRTQKSRLESEIESLEKKIKAEGYSKPWMKEADQRIIDSKRFELKTVRDSIAAVQKRPPSFPFRHGHDAQVHLKGETGSTQLFDEFFESLKKIKKDEDADIKARVLLKEYSRKKSKNQTVITKPGIRDPIRRRKASYDDLFALASTVYKYKRYLTDERIQKFFQNHGAGRFRQTKTKSDGFSVEGPIDLDGIKTIVEFFAYSAPDREQVKDLKQEDYFQNGREDIFTRFLSSLGIKERGTSKENRDLSRLFPTPQLQGSTLACGPMAIVSDMESVIESKLNTGELKLSPWHAYVLIRASEINGEPCTVPKDYRKYFKVRGKTYDIEVAGLDRGIADVGFALQTLEMNPVCQTEGYTGKADWPETIESSGPRFKINSYASLHGKGYSMENPDLEFVKILIDNGITPMAVIKTDRRIESEDWIKLVVPSQIGHVVNIVGYGVGIDPHDLTEKPYLLIRDSNGEKPIHYKVSAQKFLKNLIDLVKIKEVERVL